MNILIKAGLIFLIVGGLSFVGLMFVVLRFGVGGSGNPLFSIQSTLTQHFFA